LPNQNMVIGSMIIALGIFIAESKKSWYTLTCYERRNSSQKISKCASYLCLR
jgi:hypothetical protein